MLKVNKRLLAAAAALSVLLFMVSACAQPNFSGIQDEPSPSPKPPPISVADSPPPDHFTTYLDEAGFFSISYPDDWRPIELSGSKDTRAIAQEIREGDLEWATTVFTACLPPTNTPGMSINVNSAEASGNSLYYETQQAAEEMQRLLSEFNLVSLTEATIAGRDTVIMECVADYTGEGVAHYIHLLAAQDQALWTVSCSTEVSQFEDYQEDLYQIIYSFRLLD